MPSRVVFTAAAEIPATNSPFAPVRAFEFMGSAASRKPAITVTRSSASRPMIGRSRTVLSGSTVPTDDDEVAINVSTGMETSTDWATFATFSVKFNRTC